MENDSRIEEWLSARAESNKTRESYLFMWQNLTQFCTTRNMNPMQLVDDYRNARDRSRKTEGKFLEQWQDLIRAFPIWLKKKGLAPLTIKNNLSTLKSFCHYWKIPLDVDLPRHSCVIWHNRDLKADEIRQILTFATARDRTIWLLMAESGLRVENAVGLQYWQIKEDFEAKRVPMMVLLPSSSLKDHVGDRWTFIGEDGFKALSDYLERSQLNANDYVFKSEKPGRVTGEQFSTASLSVKFNRIVQKLGICESTGSAGKPKPVRLHGLRKYFRNNMKADSAFVNFWMGHSLGVDAHYISRDVEDHRKRYEESYGSLRLYETDSKTVTDLYGKIREKDSEITQLKSQIDQLSERFANIEKILKEMRRETG